MFITHTYQREKRRWSQTFPSGAQQDKKQQHKLKHRKFHLNIRKKLLFYQDD